MTPRNASWLLMGALSWCALPVWGHESPEVEVVAAHAPVLGGSDSAGQGVLSGAALAQANSLRPAQVLEQIPGLVVTQHSGEGKANQYFVRGMNLDHGSDWLSTLDGVPLNLPSHAHGQGYTDLNFLMPELVQRIDYRKGPYGAAEGDFASAGAAHIATRTRLDRPLLVWSQGQGGYQRALAAGSRALSPELQLLGALEQVRHNGPWTTPEGLRRDNAFLSLSTVAGAQRWRVGLSSYAAHWTATDPVPQRLLQAGTWPGLPQPRFGRFDSLDPSDGARTRRESVTFNWQQHGDAQLQRLDLYALTYALDLYSNFTYSLARASDQFGQTEQRRAWGGHWSHSWWGAADALPSWRYTVGLQFRQDRLHSGLFDSQARQWVAAVREDAVQQRALGLYAQSDIAWRPQWRTVLGLRADQVHTQVSSLLQPLNSGQAQAAKLSPKLSVVWGPWAQTEWFVSAGRGFHSNDARGTTTRVDPRSGESVTPVPALVGSRGQEVGLKALWWDQAPTTLTVWRLDFDSELVYAGDTGSTVATRPSHRVGVEWSQRWLATRHWTLDAHGAWTRPRYTGAPAQDSAVVNAVQQVGRVNLQWRPDAVWSGALEWRYVGSAPLTGDNSVRSAASRTVNLRLQQRTTPNLTLALDVLNLSNRQSSDIAYFYTSRLPGEPAAGVADVHSHPALPRTVRLTARLDY